METDTAGVGCLRTSGRPVSRAGIGRSVASLRAPFTSDDGSPRKGTPALGARPDPCGGSRHRTCPCARSEVADTGTALGGLGRGIAPMHTLDVRSCGRRERNLLRAAHLVDDTLGEVDGRRCSRSREVAGTDPRGDVLSFSLSLWREHPQDSTSDATDLDLIAD